MTVILDASALLAFLQDEPGSDAVESVLADSVISTVNWSEVVQKSIANDVEIVGMLEDLQALGLKVVDFTYEHAEIAAHLWQQTRQFGLSLADRSCLATARHLDAPVFTSDRIWAELGLPLEIGIVR